MPPSAQRAHLVPSAVTALILFGCIPVTVKFIAANPYTIGIFRLGIAATGALILTAARGQLRRLPPRDVLRLAVIGFFFFAHWLTLFLSIKSSSASIGAIGLSTYGVHLLLLGALAGHGRVHGSDIAAVVMAVAGAMTIVPEFRLHNQIATGMLLATVSALFYAALPILHQRWSHLPTTLRALGQFAFALGFFLLFLGKTDWSLGARDWAGLLFLTIGVTLIGHSLWVHVTTHLSPAATSIIYYGNIPIALALNALVLREPLTTRTLLGAALIIGGSVFGLYRQWKRSSDAPIARDRAA